MCYLLASETLYRGNKLRIGDICLMFGRMYVIFVLNPHVLVLVRWPTLSQTSLNRIFWFINLYPYYTRKLNCLLLWILLWVQLKLIGIHFLSELAAVVCYWGYTIEIPWCFFICLFIWYVQPLFSPTPLIT